VIILGIDPGKSGAVAVYDNNKIYTVYCPDTQREMADLLKRIKGNNKNIKAYIEKVSAFRKKKSKCPVCKKDIYISEGSKSIWTFSGNYASWKMGLIMLDIPFEEIPPGRWQKLLGCLPKNRQARKNEVKRQMQNLYPYIKVTLKNADALAILTVMIKEFNKAKQKSLL